jgi:hypothetical protein
VSTNSDILLASKAMLAQEGCLYKKRTDLKSAVDYLEDRIAGSQFIEAINESVREGNRVGKIRQCGFPFIYSEGFRQRYVNSAATNRVLTDEQKKQIAIARTAGGLTYEKLAAQYGVSINTIARAVKGRR